MEMRRCTVPIEFKYCVETLESGWQALLLQMEFTETVQQFHILWESLIEAFTDRPCLVQVPLLVRKLSQFFENCRVIRVQC